MVASSSARSRREPLDGEPESLDRPGDVLGPVRRREKKLLVCLHYSGIEQPIGEGGRTNTVGAER